MTALSLAAPVQILMSAMGLGIAVGLNTVISRALGERNRKRVEETASAALVLAIYVNSVLMAITPTIFTPSILLSMKALSAVVKSLCQCFSVPQTAGIRHVSVFPAVLPCFDGGRHNAGSSLSISVYQARHAPSQHCGPSRAVRQAVSVEVLDKKADDQCPGVTGIHIFRFTFGAPYIHHFLSECFCGVMSGTVMVKNPYIQPKNSFIPCA